jgi:hypothetical protein
MQKVTADILSAQRTSFTRAEEGVEKQMIVVDLKLNGNY